MTQLAPEFVEIKIEPYHMAAATFVPSAEQAIENALPEGKFAFAQINPPFVEQNTGLTPAFAEVAANSTSPLVELTNCHQGWTGAVVAIKRCALLDWKATKVNATRMMT